MRLQMVDLVVILRDNAHLHIAMLVTIIFQGYGWEVL